MITAQRHFLYDISDNRAEGTVQMPRLNISSKATPSSVLIHDNLPRSFITEKGKRSVIYRINCRIKLA